MSLVADVEFSSSVQNVTTRRVSIRRDGEDFVVVSLAEDLVVFRNNDARALRKLCRSLRWEIVLDSCRSADDPIDTQITARPTPSPN
jgi:hypothetical protein